MNSVKVSRATAIMEFKLYSWEYVRCSLPLKRRANIAGQFLDTIRTLTLLNLYSVT
jgi:hypothetical protein